MPAEPLPRIGITGSGPVAMAFALWLRRQGIGPDRIEWARREGPPPEAVAARAIALSAGSIQLLERIVPMPRSAPIHDVDVRVGDHPGSMRMAHAEHDVPALGRVVRYGELVAALGAACDAAGFAGSRAEEPGAMAGDAVAIEVCADGSTG